jgi:hypothetical protein
MRNAVIFFTTWTVVGALLASWRIARASIQLTSTGELEAARPGGGSLD